MNFKTYDFLSALVPGFISLFAVQFASGLDYDKDYIIAYTIAAFFMGYILNTLSSWFEEFYFWSWSGKPSYNLLNGKGIKKVKFYEWREVKEMLIEEAGNEMACNDQLFGIAKRHANNEKDTRINDFNAIYAFSRVMLTTVILSLIFLWFDYHNNWQYYAISLPLLFIIWQRSKERAYYYTKEVLNVYLNKKQKEKHAA